MDNKQEIKDSDLRDPFADRPSIGERVGLVVDGMNTAVAVKQ